MTPFTTPDELLPDGPLPIWIEFPNQKFTQLDILGRVAELEEIRGSSVTVMYPHGKKEEEALAFCETRDWRYHDAMSMYGLEDETIVVLDPVNVSTLEPEFISRANSKLIIATSGKNR